jgi:succinyl-diaminopimelate desuccinylase
VRFESKINRSELLNLLADLISIDSINPAYSSHASGEARIAEYVIDYYRQHKISFEKQEVLPGRFNVIGKLGGRDSRRCLIFDAHLDTVSVDGMTIEPFTPEVRDNRMFGRGSCDTKAGMAGMMTALRYASQSEVLPTNIWLTTTVDEECLFSGIRHFAKQGIQANGAVIAEPTQLDTIIAHKGCVRWKIATHGRSAHSAKPQLGVNAISQMAKLIHAIESRILPRYELKRHPLLGTPTLNIGMVKGGIQVNLVPEYCEIQIDRRTLPGEEAEDIRADFQEVVNDLTKEDPEFRAVIEAPFLEDSSLETPPGAAIVGIAESVCRSVIGRSRLEGVPYATNASQLSRIGIPSLVLGPGNIDQAHTALEFVDIDQVVQAAEIYLGIMLSFR